MTTFIVKVRTASLTSTYFAIAASTADAIMAATERHAEEECVIAAQPHHGASR